MLYTIDCIHILCTISSDLAVNCKCDGNRPRNFLFISICKTYIYIYIYNIAGDAENNKKYITMTRNKN